MSELKARRPLRSKEGYGSYNRCITEAVKFFTKFNESAPTLNVDYFIYLEAKDGLYYFVEVFVGRFK